MAIAFDSQASVLNSMSWSHTCSGANRILFVGLVISAASPTVSSMTYGGVAMTQIGSKQEINSNSAFLYYLLNPASGANTVSYSAGGSPSSYAGFSSSYNGVKQSGQPDAGNGNVVSNSASITEGVTTVADGCWMVMMAAASLGTISAGTGANMVTSIHNNAAIFDTGGQLTPAGAYTMTLNAGSGSNWPFLVASFSPNPPVAYTMVCASGSYSLTGGNNFIGRFYTLACQAGAYALTGNPVILRIAGWLAQAKSAASWITRSKSSATWYNQQKSP